MSIGTLLGFLGALGLFFGAIATETDNYGSFWSTSSAIMVVGGTLAAAFIGYQARYVLLALKEVGFLFIKGKVDRKLLTAETGKIIRWGYLVKKSGMLALEKEIKGAKNQDHFLNYGVELVISGYSGEEVRSMLGASAASSFQRGMVLADILKNMAAAAPAFGMIGTLVGLVGMLQNMSDPKAIGPAMAIALLTTLYGAFIANVIAKPLAEKLDGYSLKEQENCDLIIEGVLEIRKGEMNPRVLEDLLKSRLSPVEREKLVTT